MAASQGSDDSKEFIDAIRTTSSYIVELLTAVERLPAVMDFWSLVRGNVRIKDLREQPVLLEDLNIPASMIRLEESMPLVGTFLAFVANKDESTEATIAGMPFFTEQMRADRKRIQSRLTSDQMSTLRKASEFVQRDPVAAAQLVQCGILYNALTDFTIEQLNPPAEEIHAYQTDEWKTQCKALAEQCCAPGVELDRGGGGHCVEFILWEGGESAPDRSGLWLRCEDAFGTERKFACIT